MCVCTYELYVSTYCVYVQYAHTLIAINGTYVLCRFLFLLLPFSPLLKVIEASDLFAELFVTSVAMLESDYESEFVMATRLLEKVMGRLDLSKAENEEKLDNLFKKINWSNFPGVQALLMKVRWCETLCCMLSH